jgi:hypothetical protein
MKLAYLIVIAIFLAGVLCLWNNSIQDRKYEDIVSCWEKQIGAAATGANTSEQIVLCDMLSTHKLQSPFIGPFSI